ncbi:MULTISPECIES: HAD-IIA family hydrolase [Pseudonocardia]|uniref:HAD-IIA family hydrolase n=1 Tax=Pseudonocardia TaxID=1847 RepID=UPI0035A25A43
MLFDLDGTLVRAREPLPGAPEVVAELRRRGTAIRYLTNNACRGPASVAALLSAGGFPASADDVSTSAQAAADLLARRLRTGARVLVVGTDDLRAEVEAVDLVAVGTADDDPVAVVQGFSPQLDWSLLAEACLAIRAGAWWVATNRDVTLPGPRGLVPGNGSMVAALRAATDREPVFAGKPEPALFHHAARAGEGEPVLVVGDRLDTDIAGAARAGLDAIAVLSGVTRPIDVLSAVGPHRPWLVAADVTGLLHPIDGLAVGPRAAWRVESSAAGVIVLHSAGRGSETAEPPPCAVDALRSLCSAWWTSGGEGRPQSVDAGDQAAAVVLSKLGLEATVE